MKLHNNQLALIRHLILLNFMAYADCLTFLDTENTGDRIAMSYAFRPLTKNGYLAKSRDGIVTVLQKGRELFPEERPLISVATHGQGRNRVLQVSRVCMWMEKCGIPIRDRLPNTEEPAFIPSACWRKIARGILSTTRFAGVLAAHGKLYAVYDIGDGTIENLLTAEPHGRNQLLADALKRVGLAEKTGRGIDRIFEGSLIYGRALPDYSATTTATVSLFIPRCKPDVQLAKMIADEQNRLGRPLPINTLLVLNMLKKMPKSDVKQLSEALNLPETLVKTVLDKSIENGLVEAYGAGRGRNYILAHNLFQDKSKSIGYVRQKDIDETRYTELILNMAHSNEFISRADVMNLLHVKDSKAYGLLKKLAEEGHLIPVNKGRYAKYRIK